MKLLLLGSIAFTMLKTNVTGLLFIRKWSNQLLRRSSSKNCFVSTPIYYVNGDPHIGHAYTSVLTDIIAKFRRSDGHTVFALTGTDEHGLKVEQSSILNNLKPIQFADQNSQKFRALTEALNCSFDDFIRTTEDRHVAAVTEIWQRLVSRNQIYKGFYEGWYSIRDEAFYSESELVDGKAPSGATVDWVKEESYFFRLSNWTEKIIEHYESHPDFVMPRSKRTEMMNFLKQEGGLRDLSISRNTFKWGIPVPGDESHVVYVWLDALTNYITALGFPQCLQDNTSPSFSRFHSLWGNSLHIVGKDILRFHAIYWPAILMAADLPPPTKVFAHGWWTRDGQKMSKSVGNVICPSDLLRRYGSDYLRYYFASELVFGQDGDFTQESFCNRINADLADKLGNLLQRFMVLVRRHCNAVIPVPSSPSELIDDDNQLLSEVHALLPTVRKYVDELNVRQVCEELVRVTSLGNKYFDVLAPWNLIKQQNMGRFNTTLYVTAELLRHVSILLKPIAPIGCNKMLDQLGIHENKRDFAALRDTLGVGVVVGDAVPVFPRILVDEDSAVRPSFDQGIVSKYSGLSKEQLVSKIGEVGGLVRKMKLEKASRQDLQPIIDELKYLKSKL